ncbi:MAG: His/Gly/Thr/Pro-type tRNA ligase C-terminal domain-containing protein [Clostridium sp.]|nr:MAG: His/Gly/Thr/Pro-type tRNA ligase C-terminal domain-containing protein [Clostridium sp.]
MLYERLLQNGIDTILDDRKESVGVKFNDMDLLGIPIRITVGRKLSDDYVEFKLRNETSSRDVKTGDVLKIIDKILNNN